MIHKIRRIIDRYTMLNPGDRVVIGVSAGPDSMALLHVLSLLSAEYKLELIAAHVNHGLRGADSDEEESFAGRQSKDLGVPFESTSVDIRGLCQEKGKSIEEVGREERYKFLAQVAHTYGAHKIATAHHYHDHVETVMMNLLRGCGTEGLRGIPPLRDGRIIRPLIACTRDEILSFLDIHGLSYLNDGSNFDNAYSRNKIRNRLIPLLKMQYNPNIETAIAHLSEIAGQEDSYLQEVVGEALSRLDADVRGTRITFSIASFLQFHDAVQRRIIKAFLNRLAPPGKSIGYVHIKSVLDLIRHGSPSGILDLPGSIAVRREYGNLSLTGGRDASQSDRRPREGWKTRRGDAEGPFFSYDVAVPGHLDIRELGITMTFEFLEETPEFKACDESRVVYLDYDKVLQPLRLRSRRPGDRIQPLGMEGSKTIKSYVIDKKIPRCRRAEIPLLVDREAVLWVVGIGLSERAKISDKTVRVLKVEIV